VSEPPDDHDEKFLNALRALLGNQPELEEPPRRAVTRAKQIWQREGCAHFGVHPSLAYLWYAVQRRWLYLAGLTGSLVLLALTFGVAAAQNTVPGDTLYPVKRIVEQVHVVTALDPKAKAAVQLQHAHTRLQETEVVLKRGDTQAAQALLQDYRSEMNSVAVTVTQVAQDDPEVAQVISVRVEHAAQEDLTQLEKINADVPQELHTVVTEAKSEARKFLTPTATQAPIPIVEPTVTLIPKKTRPSPTKPKVSPTLTASSTATPTETSLPTLTPSAIISTVTMTPEVTDTPSLTPGPQDTATPLPANTSAPTLTVMPTVTPEVTETPVSTGEPQPSFTPELTPSPAPTDTSSPEPTWTPEPTEMLTPTNPIEPTLTVVPTATFEPTFTSYPTETPMPTDDPSASVTAEPTESPSASSTPELTGVQTVTPELTQAPTRTTAPPPTSTLEPTTAPPPKPTKTPAPTDVPSPTETPLALRYLDSPLRS